jgi:hypothetical protein
MADVTITAANVLAGAGAKTTYGTAGGTITAGMVVYFDSTDSKYKAAQANASGTSDTVVGIALNGAANGQPLWIVLEDDDFTPGGTLSLSAAAGKATYVLSAAAAGAIAPLGDLVSTNRIVFLGVAKSASKMKLKPVIAVAAMTA